MFSLTQWQNSNKWENWVGYVTAEPDEKLTPSSVEELQQIVKQARADKKRVRVTGAAHSFSGCAKPEEIAVSLHNMRGLISVDKEKKQATLHAGTYLHEIGDALREHGFALENMGDVQAQTIAGAASTSTHGTGITLGSVANQVVGWEWVDGKGELHTHERGDPETDELGNALHASLGMLGIFTKLTIQVVDLYGLRESNERLEFEEGLAGFHDAAHSHRHMEWFLFPGTNKLQQKTLSVIPPKPMKRSQKLKDSFDSIVTLNGAFYLLSEMARMNPKLTKKVSQISASSIPNTHREGYSYEVFPTPRGVKFNETEYFIKLSDFEQCITEVNNVLLEDNKLSHFPIEVRTHKGETGMLSPTQGEDCAVLSFHVYKGMDSEPLFNWVYEYMKKWQGRPHWGKVNKLSSEELHALYPQLKRFLEIREQYDPDKVFFNSWFEQKFK
ncbi:D-arabinono-1,4-lactone oxidase [Psychrobacter sp. FDAARGOS_221]|uniref:D-arabinono-1,4-lactone oxidase n=1 Tax=Psychrobacter sp. FDAARGOS_221 TaxID=1975705 RepID=UPI000BB534BF|nr:D-arabinono-1,4-lactone oxidase [Psychrobacter sp. FDAARGOS_221]PNK59559.1 FAD-binding protein [Psychrobacter sp. FDAARGOS_221]